MSSLNIFCVVDLLSGEQNFCQFLSGGRRSLNADIPWIVQDVCRRDKSCWPGHRGDKTCRGSDTHKTTSTDWSSRHYCSQLIIVHVLKNLPNMHKFLKNKDDTLPDTMVYFRASCVAMEMAPFRINSKASPSSSRYLVSQRRLYCSRDSARDCQGILKSEEGVIVYIQLPKTTTNTSPQTLGYCVLYSQDVSIN